MARLSQLRYDKGTLILHPPPKGSKSWFDLAEWDGRVERFRMPAWCYSQLLECLAADHSEIEDLAAQFHTLELEREGKIVPYPHQLEGLAAWERAGKRGVVVLPTGSGKTILAHMALERVSRSTLIVVPTLDLMQQWYSGLKRIFPAADVGLLGGGSRDQSEILIATYDSAAIQSEQLGNRYGLIIFDECHHLPSDFNRVSAEFSLAPYRLGLSATPERSDGKHSELETLIGPEVYRKTPQELQGGTLARYREIQIRVKLSDLERQRYDELRSSRDVFLRSKGIGLGSLEGWQKFVKASGRSKEGRAAMLAHREAREISFGASAKLRTLEDLLLEHEGLRTLIFTDDNRMVYRISNQFLIPAITHQTPIKERHLSLERFRAGEYPVLVTSRVLNEGVDVPEATIGIVLSGTATEREYIQRLGRILRQAEGKEAILYEVIAEDTAEETTAKRRKGEPLGKPVVPVEEKAPRAPSSWATQGLNQQALLQADIKWDDL